jgi:hypothetical protein
MRQQAHTTAHCLWVSLLALHDRCTRRQFEENDPSALASTRSAEGGSVQLQYKAGATELAGRARHANQGRLLQKLEQQPAAVTE